MAELLVSGIPEGIEESIAATCRSRLLTAASRLCEQAGLQEVSLTVRTRAAASSTTAPVKVGTPGAPREKGGAEELDDLAARAAQFRPVAPRSTLEALVISDALRGDLEAALDAIRLQRELFEEWGLRRIEPFPRTVLNLHGPPGTGKTMAAHGLAHALGRTIIATSYAQLESRYHGDGPRNVRGLFESARLNQALLFVDEAENVLSRRFEQPGQGSEQASNALRSEFLLQLEQFSGAVVFATNLVQSYDKALETRLTHLHFPLPDEAARRLLWSSMLVPELPRAADVSVESLAAIDGVCGRDIKRAVIDAATRARRAGARQVSLADLQQAIDRIRSGQEALRGKAISEAEKTEVTRVLRERLADDDRADGAPPSVVAQTA